MAGWKVYGDAALRSSRGHPCGPAWPPHSQTRSTGSVRTRYRDQVIDKNEKNVAEFKGGNEKALNALVGQIMKASQGKANPQQVNDLLRAKLG